MHVLTLDVRNEPELLLARRRSRQVAEAVGLEALDQTRVSAVVSELGRNAVTYAGGGRVAFSVVDAEPGRAASQVLEIEVRDDGPGIPHLDHVLGGTYRSTTGLGQGLLGSRRVMDSFRVETAAGKGTRVVLGKRIAPHRPRFDAAQAAAFAARVAEERAADPVGELQHQNQDLLSALATMRAQGEEIADLNRALEARGVVLAAEARTSNEARVVADDANRAKSHFLAVISHELRTPLGAILGYAALLELGTAGPLTDKQRDYVGRITRAQRHLSRLSDDFLAFAKLESGTLPIDQAPVRVADLCVATEQLTAPQMTERGLRYTGRCAEGDGDMVVIADEGKAQQVLLNLVTNAMKFTAAGGEVGLDVGVEPEAVSFTVRDTGRGIPADMLEAVFEPFVQVETRAGTKSGVGLGLAISRELARRMGGDLTVTSTVGEGSAFTLTLPRAAVG